MKYLITVLVLCISVVGHAQMTWDEEAEYTDSIAKGLRRDLWVRSYEDVSSEVNPFGYSDLDEYTDGLTNSEYESPLNEDDISAIYKCADSSNCHVYHITVSSSYMSGYGVEGHFVLLYLETKSHRLISHSMYAE